MSLGKFKIVPLRHVVHTVLTLPVGKLFFLYVIFSVLLLAVFVFTGRLSYPFELKEVVASGIALILTPFLFILRYKYLYLMDNSLRTRLSFLIVVVAVVVGIFVVLIPFVALDLWLKSSGP